MHIKALLLLYMSNSMSDNVVLDPYAFGKWEASKECLDHAVDNSIVTHVTNKLTSS